MDDNGTILLVEDNIELNIANSRALKLRGYTVLTAENLTKASEILRSEEPDIILLDVMLPDGDGIAFCEKIREKTAAHIIFLSAKTEHEDMMCGLKNGGDDYITKPFHPEELLIRIESAMRRRRMEKAPIQTIKKGMLTLDILATQAFINEEDLVLTPKEFSLLLLFVQNEEKLISAENVYEKAWNLPLGADRNSLKVTISRLRQKLEPAGYVISSLRGQGYVFCRQV
jgi:Response regulators consisting of a CheY-like receiver domain and a winged-helix DNA-binding domain